MPSDQRMMRLLDCFRYGDIGTVNYSDVFRDGHFKYHSTISAFHPSPTNSVFYFKLNAHALLAVVERAILVNAGALVRILVERIGLELNKIWETKDPVLNRKRSSAISRLANMLRTLPSELTGRGRLGS